MKRILLGAMMAVAIAHQSATSPATAATITYDLVGVTATFVSLGTDTVTGNFSFDPTTTSLSAVNIVSTGPVNPDHFTVPSSPITANSIRAFSAEIFITINFLNNLGLSSDPVSSINFVIPINPGSNAASTSVTGQAVPRGVSAVPLPAALPLFATGLGALGLLGWRRKRKASA